MKLPALRSTVVIAWIFTVLCLSPWSSLAAKTKIDADKIYYGDAKKYNNPAVVDAAKVYRHIPAHQEIIERKLTRDDPDYWPLMRKASQAFVRALRKICREKGYDLVGEVRSISIDGKTVPDITAQVISKLEKPKTDSKNPSQEKASSGD